MGFTVAQVVRGYGDVCQAVTELADEMAAPITVDEFHRFNRCLDDATAEAVTEYTRQREHSFTDGETQRSGILAHEMRNRVSTAAMAFSMLQTGSVAVNGSVGSIVARNLKRLGALIDRSLVEARVDSGNDHRQHVAVCDLVEETEVDGTLEADARHLAFSVAPSIAGSLSTSILISFRGQSPTFWTTPSNSHAKADTSRSRPPRPLRAFSSKWRTNVEVFRGAKPRSSSRPSSNAAWTEPAWAWVYSSVVRV